jgi:hypothetical protein
MKFFWEKVSPHGSAAVGGLKKKIINDDSRKSGAAFFPAGNRCATRLLRRDDPDPLLHIGVLHSTKGRLAHSPGKELC